MVNFGELPQVALFRIFSFIPPSEIQSISLVNRRCSILVNSFLRCLKSLDLGSTNVDHRRLSALVVACRNIQSISWSPAYVPYIMQSITFETSISQRLARLDLGNNCVIGDDALISMTGRMPGLIQLRLGEIRNVDGLILSRFFASVPGLRTMKIDDRRGLSYDLHSIAGFWALGAMTSIDLDGLMNFGIETAFGVEPFVDKRDPFFMRAGIFMPDLVEIRIRYVDITSWALQALGNLHHLRVLHLRDPPTIPDTNIDTGLISLAVAGTIQDLVVDYYISPTVLTMFVKWVPGLNYFGFYGVRGVTSVQQAVDIVAGFTFSDGGDRDLVISFYERIHLWTDFDVRYILGEIAWDGRMIRIE